MKVENNHLTGEFLYTNLRGFNLKGQLTAFIKENTLFLQQLFLDSKNFYLIGQGTLERKEGKLSFLGQVKPIKKRNFLMEAVNFKGSATVELPRVYLTAYVEEPKIRVVEQEIVNLTGIIRGEGKLFKSLVARGDFTNGELELHAEYQIIPENLLTFSYRNLRITEKAFKLKEKVNAVFEGEGVLRFKEKKLKVSGVSRNILVGKDTFGEGSFEFNYILGKEGKLTAYLSNHGDIRLKINLGKGGIKGEVYGENYSFSFKELTGKITGKVNFEKTKDKMFAEFSGNLANLSYREVVLPQINFEGYFKNSQLVAALSGRGLKARLRGKPDDLNIELALKNFRLRHRSGELIVPSGAFILQAQGKHLKGKGNFTGLNISSQGVRLVSSGKIRFKKDEHLYLDLTGDLSVFYKDKVIDESLRYAFGVNKNLIDLKGASKRTRLRLNYRIDQKKGSFGGEYAAKKAFLSFWGKIKDRKLFAEGKVRLKVLGDYVNLRGNLEVEKDYARVKLQPYRYRGKLISYNFEGLQIVKKGAEISVLFRGLETEFMKRPLLTISEAKGQGTLKGIQLSPLKLKGIVEGSLNLGYREELFVYSKGRINLTLLSKNMASLIRSELDGRVDYEFWMRGKEFRLVATTKEIVRIRSAYFYEPFIGAINLEVEPNSLMFSMVNWFKSGYLNAYAIAKDYKNFNVIFQFERVPVKYYTKELKVALLADGKGKVGVKNFKKINFELNTAFDGSVRILKIPEAKGKKETKLPLELILNTEFKTKTGLSVKLPEGRLFTALSGKVYGRYPDVNYDILVQVKSGKVSYFGKDFIVKGGKLELRKKDEEEERYVDLELNTWEEPYKIFLKVKGELENPEVYYFSEPPLSRRDILLRLIGGGGNNAVLPVATALSQELEQVGAFKGTLERLFDVKIGIGVQTTPTGELGAAIDLRKRISRLFSIKYRLSTLKDKRATYWEVEARPPLDADVGFHFFLYSDETREYRLGYRKEFNF